MAIVALARVALLALAACNQTMPLEGSAGALGALQSLASGTAGAGGAAPQMLVRGRNLHARGLDQGDEFEAGHRGVALAARAGLNPDGLLPDAAATAQRLEQAVCGVRQGNQAAPRSAPVGKLQHARPAAQGHGTRAAMDVFAGWFFVSPRTSRSVTGST